VRGIPGTNRVAGGIAAGPDVGLVTRVSGRRASAIPAATGGAPQAETYNPLSRTLALVAGDARLAGQFSAVAPLSAGRVLVTGGYGNSRGPQASAWLYRP
jgi:hypothetical protein